MTHLTMESGQCGNLREMNLRVERKINLPHGDRLGGCPNLAHSSDKPIGSCSGRDNCNENLAWR